MDHTIEGLISMSQHRHLQVSPYLSTQLNETICSCRCGCGCNCAGHGEYAARSTSSESETAVESSSSENEGSCSIGHQVQSSESSGNEFDHMDETIVSPRAVSWHALGWLLEQIGELPASLQHTSLGGPHHGILGGTANSLFNEAPRTDSRSNAVSERGNLQKMSPGPGIGALFVSDGTEDVDYVYYFDVSPLRLSAEYEHARGRAKEHMLIPDEEAFREIKH